MTFIYSEYGATCANTNRPIGGNDLGKNPTPTKGPIYADARDRFVELIRSLFVGATDIERVLAHELSGAFRQPEGDIVEG